MPTNFEDFGVKPRSIEEIEALAENLRTKLGCGSLDPIPNIAEALGRLGFCIHVMSSEQMNKTNAFADATNGEIYIREDVVGEIQRDAPLARWSALHEVGHVDLAHTTQARAFLVDGGNELLSFLSNNGAEWQANTFSDAAMMPVAMVHSCTDARQLATKARAPLERAFVRFNLVTSRGTRRTPKPIEAAIANLRATVNAESVKSSGNNTSAEDLKRSMWLALPVLGGNSRNWRIVDGRWAVFWDYFERSKVGGWRLVDGKIVAWEDERSR